jgi:hypothetical protein
MSLPMNAQPTNTQQQQRPTIFFAVLCYGGQVFWDWQKSVNLLLTKTSMVAQVATIAGDSLVCRARNNLASEFLASGCTHMLFIDCDIEFEPWHVARLLSHNKPLVCGMYPLKQIRPGWVVNNVPGEVPQKDGLVKVRESGTGFMLIKREVLVEMAKAHPELEYDKDDNEKGDFKRYDFFSVGVFPDPVSKRRRYLSEDYYFCQRYRAMGGDVWLDTQVRAKHIGRAVYPIAESELREAVFAYDQARTAQEQATKPAA